jgi:hypothetical protein
VIGLLNEHFLNPPQDDFTISKVSFKTTNGITKSRRGRKGGELK